MAVDSLRKASTHKKGLEVKPGKSDNWVERTGPGGKGGQLPAYIQHIALAIERKQGLPKSRAIAIAIGTVKKWARGGGDVDANTRAAATKAVAEWEAMKAKAKVTEAAQPASRDGKKRPEERTRTGGDAEFERQHPRGRSGAWTLKQGASGADVRAVQRKVGASPDGKFGPKTAAAIRAYQRKHGLQVDGIVGRQTAAALAGDKNARRVRPGGMSAADRRELGGLRKAQTRRRAVAKPPAEDSAQFNWRKNGNGQRGVILRDGSRKVVDGAEYDRLKKRGHLSPRTPKLAGD